MGTVRELYLFYACGRVLCSLSLYDSHWIDSHSNVQLFRFAFWQNIVYSFHFLRVDNATNTDTILCIHTAGDRIHIIVVRDDSSGMAPE